MDNNLVKFAVGGPVQTKAGTYISRPTDDELLAACQAGVFSYVLASRQVGKSSLMNETVSRLSQLGVKTARLDLNRIGRNVEDAESWFFSLLHILASSLRLNLDVQAWWDSHPPLASLNQRLLLFFDEVILSQISEPIVIFIDEIDMTLGFDFTDDFFGAIRVVHNERAQNPAYKRLTFVLLGVATPDELIQDHTRTPFNIGQAIILHDFTEEECVPFHQALEHTYPGCGKRYFRQIYGWTNGHPYLTQKLCLAVINASSDDSPTLVNDLVRQLFTAEEARSEDNIQFVQNRVLGDPHAQAMLKVYKRILQGSKGIPDDKRSPAINRLKLYGLILAENGRLQIRNKIYTEAFDSNWIEAHLVSNHFRSISIGVIALLLAVSIGLFILNQQISQEAKLFMDEIPLLQKCIQSKADETMQDEFECLTQLIDLTSDNPIRASLAKDAFNKLSYAQKLFLFENATNFARPHEYLKLVEETYTWLDNTEENNNLLDKMQHFLTEGYPLTEETNELVTKINVLQVGRDHLANQRWSEAEAVYTRIIKQTNRPNPYTYLERGQVRLAQENWLKALEDFEDFLEINSTDTAPILRILQNPTLRQTLQDSPERYPSLNVLFATLISEGVAVMPASTPTSTPEPTTSPTIIPSLSLTNTSPATPNLEVVPPTNLAPTPPAISTPTSIRYEAPKLIEPAIGVGRLGILPIFKWWLEGYRLQPGEYFSLRIWTDNPKEPEIGSVLLEEDKTSLETTFDSEFIYSYKGKVYWSVAVVQAESVVCNELCTGRVIALLSPESEIGWFAYDNLDRVGEEITQIPIVTNTQPEPTVSPTDVVPTPTEVPQTPSATSSLPSPELLTPTPTPTFTPTPTPTPDYVTGVVSVSGGVRLMLRYRPLKDIAIVERLENGTEAIVLGRTDDNEWFRVLVPSSGNEGWVDANFITLDDPSEFTEIPVLNPGLVRSPEETGRIKLLDLVSNETGTLAPGQSTAYRFAIEGEEVPLILVFSPNVNAEREQLQFIISREGQPIAYGGFYNQLPASEEFGGLVWGGITYGEILFLDIFNNSSETVEFCLSPREVFEWVCN